MSRSRVFLLILALALALPSCSKNNGPNDASGPLSVSCSATPTSGPVPLTVSFSAQPSGGDGNYDFIWSFGDGSAASVQDASRTFAAPGTYQVTLEVRSAALKATCSQVVTAIGPVLVVPKNVPPLAVFKVTPSPPRGAAPLTVDFNACLSSDADHDPLTFKFDVGDGLYEQGHCRKEHTYKARGTYRARICVNDDFPGHSDQCQSYTVSVQ